MKMIKLTILLSIALIATNCTHTRVVSFTDPDAVNKSYSRIAVMADETDLSDRMAVETQMVETLFDNGVNAVSSISLLPPTREFTIEQENKIFKDNNVDALVVIEITDSGFLTTSEPIRVKTKSRKKGGKKVSRTTISGGGTEHKAFGQLRVSLIDIESDKTMWIGDADSRAFFDTFDPDWDMEYLLKASSKKIARELIETGLIKVNR
ncbi:MAG: hypothetical protein V3R52_07240 [Candidatus Neomarinimicrobiota bacterium]